MKEWKKVDCFAGGVIYACGNVRKIVTPGNNTVYYEVEGLDIRWHSPASTGNPDTQKNQGTMVNAEERFRNYIPPQ